MHRGSKVRCAMYGMYAHRRRVCRALGIHLHLVAIDLSASCRSSLPPPCASSLLLSLPPLLVYSAGGLACASAISIFRFASLRMASTSACRASPRSTSLYFFSNSTRSNDVTFAMRKAPKEAYTAKRTAILKKLLGFCASVLACATVTVVGVPSRGNGEPFSVIRAALPSPVEVRMLMVPSAATYTDTVDVASPPTTVEEGAVARDTDSGSGLTDTVVVAAALSAPASLAVLRLGAAARGAVVCSGEARTSVTLCRGG
jgi:hypothetical protein